MNPLIKTSSLTTILASALYLSSWLGSAAIDWDNPPIGYCCGCILSTLNGQPVHVTVEQLEPVTDNVIMESKSIEGTESVFIHKDKTGYYHLRLTVPNTCTTDPTVVLTDFKGLRWVATGDVVNFTLIAHQIELPISVQVYCPGGNICRTGLLDAKCRSCEKAGCPLETCYLDGGVASNGAGGENGEFRGSFGLGTSDNGDTSTGMSFEINPTSDLTLSDLRMESSGGFTRTGSGPVQTGTTLTTFIETQNDTIHTLKVETFLLDSGSPPAPITPAFRTLLFENLVNNTLKVTVTDNYDVDGIVTGSSTYWHEWRYSAVGTLRTWQYVTGSGMRCSVLTHDSQYDTATTKSENMQVYDAPAAGTQNIFDVANLVSNVTSIRKLFGEVWKKSEEVIDPDGQKLTTKWDYYLSGVATSGTSFSGAGLLKSVSHYDGREETHHYDTTSHTIDSKFAGTTCQRISACTWAGSTLKVTVTETVPSCVNLISKKETTHSIGGKLVEEKLYTSGSTYLTTTTAYDKLGANFGGAPTKMTHPDGTISTWDYSKSGVIKTAVTSSGAGTTDVTEGTSTETTITAKGQIQSSKTTTIAIGGGNGIIVDEMKVATADRFGRPLVVYHFPSPTGADPKWQEKSTYSCCGVATEMDKDGIITSYTYDAFKRRISSTRSSVTAGTVYDPRITSTYRGAPANVISSTVRNLAGDVIETWGRSPQTGNLEPLATYATTYRNPVAAVPNPDSLDSGIGKMSIQTAIEVADDGGAAPIQTTLYYLDGRIYQSTGDLGPDIRYSYGANSTSVSRLEETATEGEYEEKETTVTTTDLAGRTITTAKFAGMNGNNPVYTESSSYSYYTSNAIGGRARLGKLRSVTDADGVRTLYDYNAKGERVVTALDVNGSDDITLGGTDQITTTSTFPETYSDGTTTYGVLTTTTRVYSKDTVGTSPPTIATVSTVRQTPDGLNSWTSGAGTATTSTSVSTIGPAGINWALASQGSSTSQSGAVDNSSRAIDGNTNGILANGSVTETSDSVDSWWQVDFGQPRLISRVVLFNCTDTGLGDRLSNFRISACRADGTEIVGENFFAIGHAGPSFAWDIPGSATASKIRISLIGHNNIPNGILSLAEVQALEFTPDSVNWALASQGSTASQSSTTGTAGASLAIDGNTDGDRANGSVTETTDVENSSWQVDFGQTRTINRIVVFNRTDANQGRLSNFKISVYNAAPAPTLVASRNFFEGSGSAGATLTWELTTPVEARTVKIEFIDGQNNLPDGILSLAEVQAFLVYRGPGQVAGIRNELTTNPDGTRSRNVYLGGRLVFSERRDSASAGIGGLVAATSYGYDELGRLATTSDSRTGATTTSFVSATCDAVATVTDSGGRATHFSYDHRGRRTEIDAPDSDDPNSATTNFANITTTHYYPNGSVADVSGGQTYHTSYTYDYAGRMKSLKTYRTSTATATTTWIYNSVTGRLIEKNYDGETDDGTVDTDTDYSYTPAGRLRTRRWERGVTTTYYYNRAGALWAVDYSDTTPDILYVRNRWGGIQTVSQGTLGVSGTTPSMTSQNTLRSNSYNYNFSTLRLTSENLNGGTPLERTLNRYYDAMGRPLSMKIETEDRTEYSAAYGFDAVGRLDRVWDHPALNATGVPVNGTGIPLTSGDFTYRYLPNSDGLLQTVTGPAHTVTSIWETTRDVLASKTNIKTIAPSSVVSSYEYSVDAIGHRETVTRSGTKMSAANAIGWYYNDRGELTAEDYNNDASNETRDRAYQYDAIGNREISRTGTTASSGGIPTEYYGSTVLSPPLGANALNQYAGIKIGVDDLVTPGYDLDGNATSYPLPVDSSTNAILVWDAENRLIEVSTAAAVTTYSYDYLSRRISKTVDPDGEAGPATAHYLYDGWNLIAEFTGTALTKTYVWGMDLSGSIQGAGGVGGLLAVSEHDLSTPTVRTPYYPTFDGNGNVSEYLDDSGEAVAHYEYDAFGNTVATLVDGGGVDINQDFAHRFSTKSSDAETGLYYYGYRYYDPITGRWPSRDPIGERGGKNLYVFVANTPLSSIDILGMSAGDTIKVSKCQIYVYYGHLNKRDPLKWDFEGRCALGGAIGCNPQSNNPPADERHQWPAVPVNHQVPGLPVGHDDQMTIGDGGKDPTDKGPAENARNKANGGDEPSSEDEHGMPWALENLSRSVDEMMDKLCAKCCKEIEFTLHVDSSGSNSRLQLGIDRFAPSWKGHLTVGKDFKKTLKCGTSVTLP